MASMRWNQLKSIETQIFRELIISRTVRMRPSMRAFYRQEPRITTDANPQRGVVYPDAWSTSFKINLSLFF
jgi:hypothetical protein